MFNDPQQNTPTQGDIQSGNALDAGQSQPARVLPAPTAAVQPQAAQPAQAPTAPATVQTQAAPAVPAATPASTSKSPGLHHFISSVLGALSGQPPPQYNVDPANGKLVASPAPSLTNRQKIGRITSTALSGLAAGSQVPPQKSGLAAVAAGLGAGANVVGAQNKEADQANKQSARDDFERDQQLKLRKMEIARANALQWTNHLHNIQVQNELDPQRAQNLSTAKDLEEGGVNVRYLTADEAETAAKGDMQFTATHILLPLGFKPMTDSNGNPILDANGQPKSQGQVAVIDGMHDGKVAMPKAWADDVQKYGKLSGIKDYESIKAGDEYGLDQINVLHGKVLAAKKQELQGWVDAEEGFGGPDGKTPGKINKITGEFKPNAAGVEGSKQAQTVADIAEKQQQVKTGKSTEAKNYAEANKANTDANQQKLFNPSGAAGLTGDAYLNTLPQDQHSLITAIAEGRNTKAAIQNRKGELTPLGLAVMQAYPDFDVQKAAKYGDTLKEYQSAKSGTAGGSLNAGATALKHLAELKAINDAHPVDVRIHGTKANQAYNNQLDTVADELVTFYGEPKTNEAIASKKATLGAFANRDAAIRQQVKSMGEKFQSLQQTWDNASPRASFRPPMPYIDNDARTALQTLVPEFVQANPQFAPQNKPQQQPNQPQNQRGQQPQVPAGGQPILRSGQTVGYILNGKRVNF